MTTTAKDQPPLVSATADGSPRSAGADVVRAFLRAMERRDLAAAKDFLLPEFTMIFPGNARFTELEELVAWGGRRYRAISKTYAGFDELAGGEDVVVYCFGTLQGTWLDGTPFDGIRFIDRFTTRNSKLLDQQVWNDLVEALHSA